MSEDPTTPPDGQELGVHGPMSLFEAWREADQKNRTDSKTGLLNHETFTRELERLVSLAEAGKAKPAIINIDLDRFKLINDTYGHAYGDQFLEAFSKMLKASLRLGDVVDFARLGGDEFGILVNLMPHTAAQEKMAGGGQEQITELSDEDRANVITTRLADGYASLLDSDEFQKLKSLGVGISFGVTLQREGMDAKAMEQEADTKMYHHKTKKKAAEPAVEESHLLDIVDKIGTIGTSNN